MALPVPEGEEGAGGDMVAIFGGGYEWVFTKPSHLSPPASPISGRTVETVMSGWPTNPLKNFYISSSYF